MALPKLEQDPRTPRLALRVLGDVGVTDAQGLAAALPVKAIALLAYLRLTAARRAHRAFLADLLWSEVDEERGRASLRQAVLTLRQVLGDDVVTTAGQEIQVTSDLTCDAADFVALATEGNYAAALDLYHGDFFAQFAVPGARSFEVWATIERERQRGIFLRAADALAQQYLDAGRAKAAVDVAKRLIAVDATRERSWRLLFEARLALGETAAARVDAESMRAVMLEQEVTIEPATETLLSRIEKSRSPVADDASRTLRAELIGRTRAFSTLLDAWNGVVASGLAVRVITGDAGYGKTRLLDDVAVRLRSLGARVVRVNVRHGDIGIPYALLQQLAETLVNLPGAAGVASESASTLVTLEPRLRSIFATQQSESVPAIDLPLRRVNAIADLFAAVCDDRPIAVMIDDLHWADAASVQAIVGAVERNRRTRLLLIVTQRPRGAAGFTGEEVPLDTLTQRDVRELIESIASLPAATWADALAARLTAASHGIPLLVLEALELLMAEGALSRGIATWETRDGVSLDRRLLTLDVLRERLSRLDPRMRSVLLQVALAGAEIDQVHLQSEAGPAGTADARDRLARDGWIVVSDGMVTVRHDEIARTILSMASPDENAAARRCLAATLESASTKSSVEWRIAARLACEAGAVSDLSRIIDRWAAQHDGATPGWRAVARGLLGEQATPDLMRRLAGVRPWRDRLEVPLGRLAAVALLVATLASAALYLRHREITPVALRYVSTPISGTTIGLVPEMAVELVNANGTRITRSGDSVTMHMRASGAKMEGRTAATTIDGVATFSDVRITAGNGPESGIFVQARFRDLATAEVRLLVPNDARLRIGAIRLSSDSVATLRGDTVFARSGASVTAQLSMQYTSPWVAASVMLAGVPSWGDRATNAIELGPFATPAVGGTRHTVLTFTAPTTPGRYSLFLIMAAESNAAHIASGTNWRVGDPIWGDGNDVMDWAPAHLVEARKTGHAQLPRGVWKYYDHFGSIDMGMAVLDVVVANAEH